MMVKLISKVMAARVAMKAASKAAAKAADEALDRANQRRHPHRARRTATKAGVPSAVAGGAVMYLFDPKNGTKRREKLMQRVMRSKRKSTTDKLVSAADTGKAVVIDRVTKLKPNAHASTDQPKSDQG